MLNALSTKLIQSISYQIKRLSRDDVSYGLFLGVIAVGYLSYLLMIPSIGPDDYIHIEQYNRLEFQERVIEVVENERDRDTLFHAYQLNKSGSHFVRKPDLTNAELLEVTRVFQRTFYHRSEHFNIYFYLLFALYLLRCTIALFYRDRSLNNQYQPTVAIIVPVKNEEKYIYQTIARCFQTGYPLDRLEVIVVNDGSTDNTHHEIERAQLDYPALKYECFTQNQGKRVAISHAVKLTEAEFFVMLDSDTFLERDSIAHLVKHFEDPNVDAVSGHTRVANAHENFLTRLQEYKYYISYRLFKAFESMFGTVICCPGCFSAYRASRLLNIVDEWNNKTFFGRRCVAGEDRSLTTLLLRDGKIKYSSMAMASTFAPTTIRAFSIQQRRWMRSWFRESLYVSLFMWRKNILSATSFYVMTIISICAPISLLRECFLVPLIIKSIPSFYLTALSIIILSQVFFCLFTSRRALAIYAIPFSLFYLCYLIWMIPVAIFTVTSGAWGSREVTVGLKNDAHQRKLQRSTSVA